MNKKLTFIFAFAATLLCGTLHAQTDWEKAFWDTAKKHSEEFDATTRTHFEQMRSRFNEEYANALDGVWKEYEVFPAMERPKRIEPDKAPVAPDLSKGKLPTPVEITPAKIVLPPIKINSVPLSLPKNPQPILPLADNTVRFDFFGTTCEIGSYDFEPVSYDANRMKLGSEWRSMESNPDTESLFKDCVRLREALSLCDMGYLWLIEHVAAKIYPDSKDSQAFMAAYLMNQSGYDVKLGMTDRGLTLLMNADRDIYGMTFIKFDGIKYYARDKALASRPMQSYDAMYGPENTIPLRMIPDRMPTFNAGKDEMVTYSSKRWMEEPEFTVTVSKPEMQFLGDYPQISWEHYLQAPVSDNFREQIMEQIRKRVAGLPAYDGVRKLLSYVQFGFDYMTDNDQYGYEKVNFPEENFFYPANDCEDRSILFATLVRDIYGLDVVLLHYPNHVSTAVDFRNPTIKGDAININGSHYVMCDPTFVGATIGMSMPTYRGVQPEVYKQ